MWLVWGGGVRVEGLELACAGHYLRGREEEGTPPLPKKPFENLMETTPENVLEIPPGNLLENPLESYWKPLL